MKICLLDAYTSNPGDLSWEAFQSCGELVVYDRTLPHEVLSRAADCEAIITNKVVLSAELMAHLPKLRYIGILATGYNVVDVEEAHRRGIVVCNVPAYSTDSVAQLCFAHLLNITHRVQRHSDLVRAGAWSQSPDFSFCEGRLLELSGKTMGIVGLGNIGMKVAHIALAFGMQVMALTSKSPEKLPSGVRSVSKQQLLQESDVLSLHCPLTESTRHFINADSLSQMKSSAILINLGRGPLVDEFALAEALNTGRLAAAGLDVLSTEPPASNHPLLSARNCYLTPHYAWASLEARSRLISIAAENLRSFLSGQPVNVV